MAGGNFASVPFRSVTTFLRAQQCLQRLYPVCISWMLVPAQPADTRETHCDAGLVPRRTLEALERHLEHEPAVAFVHDFPHRAETGDRVGAHEFVDVEQLCIREAEIGLTDRDQFVAR